MFELGWFFKGLKVQQFEKEFVVFVGVKYVVVLNLCIVVLFLILKVKGIGLGDEVIIFLFMFSLIVNMIIYIGVMFVFVDIDENMFNIDLVKFEVVVILCMKVVVFVYFGGQFCDMDVILVIV